MASDRESCVIRAKIAEQAERYDEMTGFMRQIAELGQELTIEERNLLSVAYKNAVGGRRASLRIIGSIEEKQKTKGNTQFAEIAANYKQNVEQELYKICHEILDLLNKHLLSSQGVMNYGTEAKVFYYKMKGDYYRYLAEFAAGGKGASADPKGEDPTFLAQEAYEAAQSIATADLPATHPIRLGLALNFSVFFYEILKDHERACKMAQTAFDEAISELDNVTEDEYKDSTLIMQLLRDNLTLWTSEPSQDEKVPAGAAGGLPNDAEKQQ